MKLDLTLSPRQELQLRLSPQLIQRIEILQLPANELLELIEQECSENDSLEYEPPAAERGVGEVSENGQAKEPEFEEEIGETIERQERYREALRPRISRDGERDPKLDAMANTPQPTGGLREHLLEQIRFASLPPKVREFAEILVAHLDDNGFLPEPLEEILVPLDDRFTLEEARRAYSFLRSLDPPGVGARDMRDCFLSMLDPRHPHHEAHKKLVEQHLDDLASNRVPRIARSLGVGIDEVHELVGELRHILRPPPGRLFRSEVAVPVRPDVIVERIDGDFEVRLAEENYPQLSVSPVYAELARDPDLKGRLRREIRGKVDRARFLIEAIEQRKGTLLRVAREIVDHQREFFEKGRLRPLKMRDVADRLGLHVSTVSRAISDKWMQTPRGVFPLRKFFTGASAGDESGESRDAVQDMVREIIAGEDPKNPLSDEDIVAELRRRGVRIARRTVTKYRKLMNIPSSRERRVV